MANAELERVTHMTRNMLGLYRESPFPVDVKICEVLDGVLELHGPTIRSGKVTVEKRYDRAAEIRGFPGEMRQVFSNLVANALEALGQQGTLKLHVLASRDLGNPKASGVRVFVADNGPGIPPEQRRKIFEPFFTTKGEKGTGLGLWVAHGIVRKHRGCIRVRSGTQPGRSGTCFSVFSPTRQYRRSLGMLLPIWIKPREPEPLLTDWVSVFLFCSRSCQIMCFQPCGYCIFALQVMRNLQGRG
jgi:signal transduction histidine kinase